MALNTTKVAADAAVWGDAQEFLGHSKYSTALLVAAYPAGVAPAERNDYDPTAFANQPGAAARANGYPRAS